MKFFFEKMKFNILKSNKILKLKHHPLLSFLEKPKSIHNLI